MIKILNERELDQYMNAHGLKQSSRYVNYCVYDQETRCFKKIDKKFTNRPDYKLYQFYIDINGERIISHTLLECNRSNKPIYFLFEHKNKTYYDQEIFDCINELEEKEELCVESVQRVCSNKNLIDQKHIQDHQMLALL